MFGLWGKNLQAQFGSLDVSSGDVPVVVELFTSQSCSSCPPADKVLGDLTAADNVIALSCHVDYWDHLHWKDTLSQKFCTERQRSYSRAMNSRRVYTPQMVVNGQTEFVGSRGGQAVKTVSDAGNGGAVKAIRISRSGDRLNVTLPDVAGTGHYTIWVMGYNASHMLNIPSGENRGRTVKYTNSVIALDRLGSWAGDSQAHEIALPRATAGNLDGVAIIAQQGSHGAIVAAGNLKL